MAGDDRLSALSDDLLRRVLYFAPSKEAASTVALSSRWRSSTPAKPLWRSSAAVNLEMRVGKYDSLRYANESKGKEDEALFFSRRDAFLSAAVQALDAAVHDVTRLTLRLEPSRKYDDPFSQFLRHDWDSGRPRGRNAIAVLLSHQAARRVEELRLVANGYQRILSHFSEISGHVGAYTLAMDSLPSETLRLLELTNCQGLYQRKRATVALPRLTSLRLGHCAQHLGSLQSVIDAAPALATICLEYVLIDATEDAPHLPIDDDDDTPPQSYGMDDAAPQSDNEDDAPPPPEVDGNDDAAPESDHEDDAPAPPQGGGNDAASPESDVNEDVFAAWKIGDYSSPPPTPVEEALPRRLRCPAATVLVLDRCRWEQKKSRGRHPYGYSDEKPVPVHGMEIDAPRLRRFRYTGIFRSFTFSPQPPELDRVDLHFLPDDSKRYRWEKDPDLATFWQFVGSFTSTKRMKLRLDHLEDIAIRSEVRCVELLPETFCRLKHLELQGVHRPKGVTAAVAIANLLRCCPVLHDLRINLTTQEHNAYKRHAHNRDESTRKFLERKFRYDRDKSMAHLDHCGDSKLPTVSPELGVAYDEISEIPGLSRHSFECLRSSLTRVGLQFRLVKSNCFGVKLIKFFAENAAVLEEMQIDGGNGKLFDHLNHKVETWMASSSKKKKLEVPSFVVLPLKRRPYIE